jgi:dipeptidyl aminopeptidase/acylaminoacyl peptidase
MMVAVAARRRRDAVDAGENGDTRGDVSIGRHRGGRIWVGSAASTEAKSAVPISPEGWSAWRPSWSPDSSTLAFVAGAGDGLPRLWRWSPSAGPALVGEWVLRSGVFPDDTPRWSPDSRVLYVVVADASTPDHAVASKPSTVHTAFSPPKPGQAGILSPWLAQGAQVVAVDAETGAARATWSIAAQACYPSHDGAWLAVVGQTRQPTLGSHVSSYDLWVVPSQGGAPVVGLEALATDMNATAAEPAWSPTASELATIIGHEIAIVVPGSSTRRLAGPPGLVPSLLSWFGDGRRLLVRGRKGLVVLDTTTGDFVELAPPGGDRTAPVPLRGTRTRDVAGRHEIVVSCSRRDVLSGEVWALPVNGTSGRLLYDTDGDVNLGALSVMGDDHGDVSANGEAIVFATQSPARPWRWWITNPTFEEIRPVLDPNEEVAVASFNVETIGWVAPDGQRCRTLALLPADRKPPMPTVVEIYPGQDPMRRPPRFGDGSIVPYALLVSAGYAVLLPQMPTPPGPMPSLPPAGLAATIDAAVDAAVTAGIADPRRIAIAGHSAGGWAVNLLVTDTDRFSAAISAGGISDLAAFHSHFAFRDDETWLTYGMAIAEHLGGGPPWQSAESYRHLSPIYAADRIRTPMLFLHGKDDPATPWTQSAELFACLARLGRTAQLALYDHEAHVPSQFGPTNQDDVAQRVLTFLADHLTNGGL